MDKKLSARDFEVLNYTLPSGSADEYASNAIRILKMLGHLNPKLLPNFLAANTVLTLSGVRAFDTYLVYENLEETEIESASILLASENFTLFSNRSEYLDLKDDVYSLINHQALSKIPEQYKIESWIQPCKPFTNDRFVIWSNAVELRLVMSMGDNKLPRNWQDYYWPSINIRLGILLGYPGEAIASHCWCCAPSQQVINPSVINATIKYHDAYNSAWPVYNFLDDIKDNSNIIHHQELWSDILTKVYESDWHKKYTNSRK